MILSADKKPWKIFGYSIFKEKNVSIKVYVLLSLTLLLEKHFLMAEAKYPKIFYNLEFCFESNSIQKCVLFAPGSIRLTKFCHYVGEHSKGAISYIVKFEGSEIMSYLL
jgi:hypothetical protein